MTFSTGTKGSSQFEEENYQTQTWPVFKTVPLTYSAEELNVLINPIGGKSPLTSLLHLPACVYILILLFGLYLRVSLSYTWILLTGLFCDMCVENAHTFLKETKVSTVLLSCSHHRVTPCDSVVLELQGRPYRFFSLQSPSGSFSGASSSSTWASICTCLVRKLLLNF